MLVPTLIMAVLAAVLLAYSYKKGTHVEVLRSSAAMIGQILPLLIFAFTIAGVAQVSFSSGGLSRLVGPESGLKGILVGTIAGGLTPGGPFVSLPIVAGLMKGGAGVGTLVAFVTSWSLWAVMRLPMEIGILGWRFTLVRLASTALLPLLAGWFAKLCFSWVSL